jgi:hypothetical protein
MESMTACGQYVEVLCHQAKEQAATLEPLGDTFAQEAKRLVRYDQAVCLRSLKARVLSEVDNIQRMETAASDGFTKATLITGMTKLALGGLAAAVVRNSSVLSVGAHLAESDLTRTAPFGNVMVAVGHGGLPDDVEVISLSRLARELDRLESDIEAALQTRGYLLMTPEAFSRVLTVLERRVLDGSLSLPVTSEQLPGELAYH